MKRGLWLLGMTLLCRKAAAQEGVEWDYSAPVDCPSEQQFREQVQTRLLLETHNPPRPDSADTLKVIESERVTVRVNVEPSEHRASLYFREGDAPLIERTVRGDTCSELVEAIALVTALAFGAERASAEPPSAANTVDPSEPKAPDVTPPANPPVDEPHPPASSLPAGQEQSVNASERDLENSTPLSLELGVGGLLNSWIAPDGGRGADGFVRLARERAGWSLRATALYGVGASTNVRRAEFTLWGGRLEGCPLAHPLPLKLLVEACLAVEAGSLTGRGDESSALLVAESESVPWAAALLTGRLRAALGRWVSLEAQGELGFPFVHHTFKFEEPDLTVFETPKVGFGGRIGVGVHFL